MFLWSRLESHYFTGLLLVNLPMEDFGESKLITIFICGERQFMLRGQFLGLVT